MAQSQPNAEWNFGGDLQHDLVGWVLCCMELNDSLLGEQAWNDCEWKFGVSNIVWGKKNQYHAPTTWYTWPNRQAGNHRIQARINRFYANTHATTFSDGEQFIHVNMTIIGFNHFLASTFLLVGPDCQYKAHSSFKFKLSP